MLSLYDSVFPLVAAIVLHEMGHVLAARAVGVRFGRLRLTRTGLRLITGEDGFPSYDHELICALGGPLANALAALHLRVFCLVFPTLSAFASRWIPLSLSLALLNLLPLRGFDGARIVYCFLCSHHRRLPSLTPDRAGRVISLLSCLVLTALWLLAVYLLLRRGSALSLYLFCLQLFLCLVLENGHVRDDFT
ncbi:MAG: hypothetical protein E7625_00130 [Ruminococcaceae bacterium]|nr:hypothetical protein [Oscillospiraceae bacterium]